MEKALPLAGGAGGIEVPFLGWGGQEEEPVRGWGRGVVLGCTECQEPEDMTSRWWCPVDIGCGHPASE